MIHFDRLRKDQDLVATVLFRDRRGNRPAKRKSFKMIHSHPAGHTTQALFKQEPGYQINS